MTFLTRPAGRIRYHTAGAGAPPLLLTHGYGATSAMFAPNLPALAARRLVVTWDILGHGGTDSPAGPDGYGAAAAVADMAALLDELGIARAVLGGHSLGGYLSLDFTLAYPERVAGLILIDTGPGYRSDSARDDWNARAERTATRLEQRGLAAVESSARLHGGEHQDPAGLARAARYTLTQRDAHVMNGLPAIAAPTLIVVGADDTPFLGAADYMAGKVPSARKVVIPAAGHAANVDQPELFAAEVAAFLDQIVAAPEGAA
jgi:pimeloyl-ACP methyl ester carboxylesterase